MKKLKRAALFLATCLSTLLVGGCGDIEKAKHRVTGSGTEWNVPIDVMLADGGTARLICPKFTGAPRGAHGRECYLDSYSHGSITP